MKRYLLYLFLSSATCLASPANSLKTSISEPTQLIVSTAFDTPTARIQKGDIMGWTAGIGEWRIEKEALIGDELGANHHASSCTFRLDATHLIITAQFKLGGATQIAFGCRDTVPPNLHLGRLFITPDKLWIQRMSGISKTTKSEKLVTKAVAIDPNQWYDLVIEIIGDRYYARVGEVVIEARHPRFADAKGIVALINRGQGAHFKNVQLWHAKPSS